MAKENSFDIVSEVDLQEVDNAFQQTKKELVQRYDLKDSGATVDFDKGNHRFTVTAPSDFVANQVIDVLGTKLVRRGIDLKAVRWGQTQAATGMTVRREGTIVEGIETDIAKKVSKDIRDQKFKVKPTIEGDKLRVASASRDELQTVISFLKDQDYGQPLQYVNYR
jgi:cyclic-di-GMP-binding protein